MNPRDAGSKQSQQAVRGRPLEVEEVRLVSDLRIMHSKVDELYYVVRNLKNRHGMVAIHKYADQAVLSDDIARVDEIYLWFVALKEHAAKNEQS